eukprot:TRINITY_DN64542_c0_g1_i1.p1 TRINITY_DN64542_c0_g1~~TRINITY_DN64542_c0_g1_i1.p1  ORF type:complete len:304 (-),score=47.50 TRINITY_DN64542_c0_g1_i1:33-923(-)
MEHKRAEPVPGFRRPRGYHVTSLGLLISLPFLIFLLLAVLSMFFFRNASGVMWVTVVICLCIALLFMVVTQREGPKFWFNLGGLCFLATTTGTTAGIWNYNHNTYKFWAYAGQPVYTNLRAAGPAASYLDAGILSFREEVRVDVHRSFGFKDGATFCIAPVVEVPDVGTTIEFWAVGIDCCGEDGSSFACEDAGKEDAHGGLVLLEDPLFSDNFVDRFREAVKECESKVNIRSSEDALFVRWLTNPAKAQWIFWAQGRAFVVWSCIVYFFFSIFAGIMMHFARRLPAKSKLEVRRM